MLSPAEQRGSTTQAGWSKKGYRPFRSNPINHHRPQHTGAVVLGGPAVPLGGDGCPLLSPVRLGFYLL